MKYLDIMLDLETLGLGNSPVIIQLSAVPFNLETGETLEFETFNRLVNPTSCVNVGLSIAGSTVEWWLKQDKSVINKVFSQCINESDLKEVLIVFSEYIQNRKEQHNVKDIRIWGNGVLADNKWLESAYAAVGLECPFKYYENSDVRTLVDLGLRLGGKDHKKETPFEGEKHNAIDDCKHQIKYVCAIYNDLLWRRNNGKS